MSRLNRRHFIQSSSLLGAAVWVPGQNGWAATEQGRWYRGNLHLHTQWSDGSPMPEWVVAWYKEQGYHFICTSDHNTFQTNELQFGAWCGACETPKDLEPFRERNSRWKEVQSASWGRLSEESVEQAVAKFGADALPSITQNDRKYYRLKPFDELVEQFAQPGEFLIIPGFEQTGRSQDQREVHMNFINVRHFFPYISAADGPQTVVENFKRGRELYANQAEPYMFTLNHPAWRYYDVEPDVLIDHPEIRFFELNNNGLTFAEDPNGWTPEKFWDVVNAHRARAGQPLVLATGTDDEHSYQRKSPRAWMMVYAESLDFPTLFAAMDRGDSYTSNGLDFERIVFDRDAGTLSVRVKPEPDRKYRIDWIGTKKNFDDTRTEIHIPAQGNRPERFVGRWSDAIGETLKTVEGTEATYTLAEDDLYVRARVTLITEKPEFQDGQKAIPLPGAWTQPFSRLTR